MILTATLLVVIGLLSALPAFANVATLKNAEDTLNLGPHLEYLADPLGELTINDVRAGDAAARFVSAGTEVFNVGFDTTPHWFRIDLLDPGIIGELEPRWLLEIDFAPLDQVDLWLPDGRGGTEYLSAGDLRPLSDRVLRVRNIVAQLKLRPGVTETLYLRVQTEGSLQLPLKVWPEAAFARHNADQQYLFGMFYGIMLVMLFYNAFVYVTVRDRSYLIYILFIGSMTLLQLSLNGFGALYVWGVDKPWTNLGSPLGILLTSCFAAIFARSFLKLYQHDRWLNRATLAIGWITSLLIPLAWVLPLPLTLRLSACMAAVTALTCFSAGVRAYLGKIPAARFFLLAWSVMLGGVLLKVLVVFGLVPTNLLTTYAFQIGATIEGTLLALALADRINIERRDRINAQEEALVAREAAVQSLQQYRQVVENVLEGIFRIRTDGRITSANPALAQMLGYPSPNELITTVADWRRVLSTETEQAADLAELLQTSDRVSGFELRVRRLDGSDFWGSLSAHAIRNSHGELVEIEGMLADISARKHADELARARETAEAETRAKTDFLARMSHELRTPMNAVLGFTDLALRADAQERRIEYLRNIRSASRSLLSLINDILDISKIEAGKLTLEHIEFELKLILGHLSELFSEPSAQQDVELLISTAPQVPARMRGDPTKLEQVLVNLLGNAFKFTPHGQIELRVELEDSSDSQVTLRFSVRDTGIGLSEATLQRLFVPFNQADESTTRRYGGTGLGLAISKQLVEAMGGRIWVDSVLGQGSCFNFTAAFDSAEFDTDSADKLSPQRSTNRLVNTTTASVASPVECPLYGFRLLLAEDNALNQKLAEDILRGAGAAVKTVDNGRSAVEAVQASHFDAVLMDIQMPQLTGLEATREIRSKVTRQIPIIAMTANAMREDEEHCLAAGMTDFIPKPVDYERLLYVLKQHLGKPLTAPALRADGQLDDDAQGLLSLRGINTEAALRRFGGKVAPLRRALQEFSDAHAGDGDRIRVALESDEAEAKRIAHGLKGVAATVGLEELAHCAAQLESAVGSTAMKAALPPLQTSLDAAVTTLLGWSKTAAQRPVAAANVDSSNLTKDIAILLRQLHNRSFDAESTYDSLEQALHTFDPAAAKALGTQIRSYDFESASASVEQIQRALNRTASTTQTPTGLPVP